MIELLRKFSTKRNLELEELGVMFLYEIIIVPDLIKGTRFAGEYMSIPILNTLENEWINIDKVEVVNCSIKALPFAKDYIFIFLPTYLQKFLTDDS